jgi:hypothetical protein
MADPGKAKEKKKKAMISAAVVQDYGSGKWFKKQSERSRNAAR